MSTGGRCGEGCNGATNKNAIVYFPPGTYLVSTTIEVLFGTQVIGDAKTWPTIKAASAFSGLGVLSTNEYVQKDEKGSDGLSKQWYSTYSPFFENLFPPASSTNR